MTSSKNQVIKQELICGIDEAGRGPVLGPMVLCGVCFKYSNLDYLKDIGVKDSKKLTSSKREILAKLIKNKCVCFKEIQVSSQEIDNRELEHLSLNKLEIFKMVEIINDLKPDLIYIDAADVDENRFGKSIKKLLSYHPKQIISKHKADNLFPIVSAASKAYSRSSEFVSPKSLILSPTRLSKCSVVGGIVYVIALSSLGASFAPLLKLTPPS